MFGCFERRLRLNSPGIGGDAHLEPLKRSKVIEVMSSLPAAPNTNPEPTSTPSCGGGEKERSIALGLRQKLVLAAKLS